jgi:hypothetical protein
MGGIFESDGEKEYRSRTIKKEKEMVFGDNIPGCVECVLLGTLRDGQYIFGGTVNIADFSWETEHYKKGRDTNFGVSHSELSSFLGVPSRAEELRYTGKFLWISATNTIVPRLGSRELKEYSWAEIMGDGLVRRSRPKGPDMLIEYSDGGEFCGSTLSDGRAVIGEFLKPNPDHINGSDKNSETYKYFGYSGLLLDGKPNLENNMDTYVTARSKYGSTYIAPIRNGKKDIKKIRLRNGFDCEKLYGADGKEYWKCYDELHKPCSYDSGKYYVGDFNSEGHETWLSKLNGLRYRISNFFDFKYENKRNKKKEDWEKREFRNRPFFRSPRSRPDPSKLCNKDDHDSNSKFISKF